MQSLCTARNKVGKPKSIPLGALEETMVEIVPVRESYGTDYYVYARGKLVRVCPSIGMAREVAAGVA